MFVHTSNLSQQAWTSGKGKYGKNDFPPFFLFISLKRKWCQSIVTRWLTGVPLSSLPILSELTIATSNNGGGNWQRYIGNLFLLSNEKHFAHSADGFNRENMELCDCVTKGWPCWGYNWSGRWEWLVMSEDPLKKRVVLIIIVIIINDKLVFFVNVTKSPKKTVWSQSFTRCLVQSYQQLDCWRLPSLCVSQRIMSNSFLLFSYSIILIVLIQCPIRSASFVSGPSCTVTSMIPGSPITTTMEGNCASILSCRGIGGIPIGKCGLANVCCVCE